MFARDHAQSKLSVAALMVGHAFLMPETFAA
jgi:hypothetical protein